MKMLRLVCGLLFLIMTLLPVCVPGIALAQEDEEPVADNITQEEEPAPVVAPEPEEEPTITELIRLKPNFPTVESIAGGEFQYEMECLYVGQHVQRTFDLRTTAPQGWEVYMTPRYEKDKKISSINLTPSYSTGETIIVFVDAPFYPLPEPGDYKITIEAVSEDVQDTVELTATITAKYILAMAPTLDKYNTEAEAGKDNYFSVEIGSLSTAPIDNIKFSSTKPDGWAVEFNPDNIEMLAAIDSQLDSQTVEINIKPPKDTIAGDYYVTVRATGKQASTDEMQIRVTVKTAPTWQWIGVGIIVVVVAAVIFIFMRFSRR